MVVLLILLLLFHSPVSSPFQESFSTTQSRRDLHLSSEERAFVLEALQTACLATDSITTCPPSLSKLPKELQTTGKCYSWEEMEKLLDKRGSVPFLAYGSLISPQDAARTLRQTLLEPVTIFGVKRSFNRRTDKGFHGKHHIEFPEEASCLSVRFTNNHQDTINGVLLLLRKQDFKAFYAREKSYTLREVLYQKENGTLGSACILEAQGGTTDASLKPHLVYLYVIVKACIEHYGLPYLHTFLATTTLGDETTTLLSWLQIQSKNNEPNKKYNN